MEDGIDDLSWLGQRNIHGIALLKLLHKGNEDDRRVKIMAVSRARDPAYIPQLLALVESDETYENKRHVVRALGNIGGSVVEAKLLQLLETTTGLMLGDVIHMLGQLKSKAALKRIGTLVDSEEEWVRQNAKFAIRQIHEG